MCQLIAASFNQEIQPGSYLRTLLSRSNLHPDGWGLACYLQNSKSATVFKEPVPGTESLLAGFLCGYKQLKSKIFIGHIRNASKGIRSHDNTHPFHRSYSRREFSFAHNGTLSDRIQLTKLSYQPIGSTDSERAFCYLLSQMRKHEIKPVRAGRTEVYDAIQFERIYEILIDINTIAAGSFNCVFSDGIYLYCYRDLQEARNLFYQKCKSSYKNIDISNFEPDKNSYMENSQVNEGYIVATEPINSNEWQSFAGGHLMVFKDGEIIADIC